MYAWPEHVLQVVDPGLKHALGLDGRVELGILGEVAEPPGQGDLLGDPGHFLVFHTCRAGPSSFRSLPSTSEFGRWTSGSAPTVSAHGLEQWRLAC